jgi:hypothetical protein
MFRRSFIKSLFSGISLCFASQVQVAHGNQHDELKVLTETTEQIDVRPIITASVKIKNVKHTPFRYKQTPTSEWVNYPEIYIDCTTQEMPWNFDLELCFTDSSVIELITHDLKEGSNWLVSGIFSISTINCMITLYDPKYTQVLKVL